ncbi:MAG: chemotaxis protein CheB [Micavibrio sp.]
MTFPVVGIGASAGGLEAITALFTALPADSGMAFLVVQHLNPGHASMLADILGKKTTMKVTEAIDGQSVAKNHIYVIPPNSSMTFAQGKLILRPRNNEGGVPLPIDDLFYSLAEDQGSNAIGILLSGSGSDGALGMQAIKGEGGITFAQDSSAKFSAMPQAAVELGCIDFILSPQKIAEELVRVSKHPFMAARHSSADEPVAADEDSLKRIFYILNGVYNVDFTHYKRGTMTRRLARRMALLNLDSLPAYITFLEENPEEVRALYQDLLIRVTSFFRDPEAFTGLVKVVYPALKEKASLRIWVPGCSSGEEVYSIAICLLEYLGDDAHKIKIQIFGTDVSEPSLATARAGIYVENIAREVSGERLDRFFTKLGGRYQIAKSIRDLCIFAHQNVTRDPPFSQLDLISCRNLLIYFDAGLQKQTISLFHYALRPGGYLMLGPSETIGSSSDLFSLAHDKKYKIYTKNPVRSRSHLAYMGSISAKKAEPKMAYKAPPDLLDTEKQKREIDRIALARYVPAGVLCDKNLNVLEFRGDTGRYLVQASGPPSTNLRQLARPGLLVEISNMIDRAHSESTPVRRTAVRVEMPGGIQEVTLEAIPLTQTDESGVPRFLIFFEDPVLSETAHIKESGWLKVIRSAFSGPGLRNEHQAREEELERENLKLKRELDATREHIKIMFEEHETAQEELKASQEELLSSNEEFQSTNEELETAKEELQSTNEELATMNDELRYRNDDLSVLNNQLEHARNYANAIVETVREPLLVLDKNLHIVRANAAFYESFKLTQDETEGCLFYELDNRQWDIPALRQLLQKVLPQDTSFQDYEITSIFPEIGKKTMLLNGRHMAWEDQTLILLAIEDVTERKADQDSLREVDRRKDEFLAMLAHELRNPLAPIRNALEIWRRGDAGEAAEKEAQIILDRQLRKETRLVDDLLDVARITRGSIALKQDPVDLVQVVQQAVEGTRHQYEERRHDLVLKLPDGVVCVEGDAVRLEQIVSNLLSNAAKYTEPGGRIVLTLEHQGGKAMLSVADNGIGISSKLLPRIFDLFVQADVAIDRAQGGLGIGLTLVRRLVELQGGTVEVKSEGLKKGSEFIVRLPIYMGPAVQPIATNNAVPEAPPFKARRILVVDDNVDSAKTIALLLELHGHEVQTVFDGQTALKVVQKFLPHIVLLDIGLPGMNGYEVVKQLRTMPELRETLLIALSGYGQAEDRRRSKDAGFDHHLVKPADLDQLNVLIAGYGDGAVEKT